MIDLIKEMLEPGDNITLYLSHEIEPLRAQFVKVGDSAIVVESNNGVVSIVNINSVCRCSINDDESDFDTDDIDDDEEFDEMPDPEETDKSSDKETTEDSESFSPIFTPKVVGHIDLDSITDFRRKNRHQQVQPTEDNPLVPAGGYINSIGAAFGFITASNGESLFFSRGEVMQRNRTEELHKGMPVVFTPGRNAKGGVARCVHMQMTMQEQLEWIEKLEQFDQRNARMMAEQLLLAFPDDAELADTLSSFDIRVRHNNDSYARIGVPVAEKTLEAVKQGHYVEPADLLRAEKEIVANKPYDEAFDLVSTLLRYASTNCRQQCYQLFVRQAKLARNNNDLQRAVQVANRAVEFYPNEQGARTYFEGLGKHLLDEMEQATKEPEKEEEEQQTVAVSARATEIILSSLKTDVAIIGENAETLDRAMTEINESLTPLNDCVCGRVNVNEINVDDKPERRLFYRIVRSLSDAVARKFDTEFPAPAEDEFLDVSDVKAMSLLSDAIKSLRKALTEHPEAGKRKLHVVCQLDNFNHLFTDPAAVQPTRGEEGEEIEKEMPEAAKIIMRHLKAVAETAANGDNPMVSLQLVVSSTPDFQERMGEGTFKLKSFTFLNSK